MELIYYRLLAIFQKRRAAYVLAGGKKGLISLTNDFYQIMDTDPLAQEIRQMHEADLTMARKKLYMFLSGWFGGPNLYWKAFGHPRMRARHLKFPIGPKERDQWLACMDKAIDKQNWKEEFKTYTRKSFNDFAHHMQNKR